MVHPEVLSRLLRRTSERKRCVQHVHVSEDKGQRRGGHGMQRVTGKTSASCEVAEKSHFISRRSSHGSSMGLISNFRRDFGH